MTHFRARPAALLSVLAVIAMGLGVSALPVSAAESTVGLGRADPFAVLAATTVTNTGPSVVDGNVGVSPGTALTGWPPGIVQAGSIHSADATAAGARDDLTSAWVSAAGRSTDVSVSADLAGQTLVGGVYTGNALALNGTLTLDAQGVPGTVWIFQAASTVITGSNSTVALINGADACNVFWQVGSSATLGTGTAFVGTVMALTSITANTDASIHGRLLARNGAVTLDSNVITSPSCAAVTTTTTDDGTTTTTSADTTTTTAGSTTTTTDGVTTTTADGSTTTTSAGATTTAPVGSTSTTSEATTTTLAAAASTTTTEDGGATTSTVGAASVTTVAGTTPTTSIGTSSTNPSAATTRPTITGLRAPTTSSPGAPGAPGTPGTKVPDLPRTGAGLDLTMAAATLMFLLGAICLRSTRRIRTR